MGEIINEHVEAYAYQRAKHGNNESGDAYFLQSEKEYFIFAIADGLGSGPIARKSAEVIPNVLKEFHHESIDSLLNRCNVEMLRKRGAAVAIVKVDFKLKTIQYSCVGNIRFYMLQGKERMIYPLPVMGYLNGRPQKLNTQVYKYERNDLFFMHSDGVELRNPREALKESSNAYDLYQKVSSTMKDNDDATFITGSLLL
ncbi:PP2C family serine/threonine-protein phosphatase [Sporosarcina sp. CAU 1771]